MGAQRYYYVYILASGIGGTLYVGVTNDLFRRIGEHRDKAVAGFTRAYDVERLVYYETHESIDGAIEREKRLKRWRRGWKVQLIEEQNPNWVDLFAGLRP
ncbi:GIY-YIG nuclease family protein [Pelagibacterium luteolum]|uniref:Putative endonuclease n=1 Tax=Pelagibacterium luteolum TaxID=440168 RepID=A0A1G7RTH4_9HYPH|nr:GIY-YIG nuclease family protein [Pelagibacterium luteolum]SDG13984.1 putative endonuclease [Pelagibacterium luteolum]